MRRDEQNLSKDFETDEKQVWLNPSALARAMMDYLACPCICFAPMANDEPIQAAYQDACRRGPAEGFVPMLVVVDDTLWECFLINSDEASDGLEDYTFNAEEVEQYRKAMLSAPVGDGKAILEEMLKERREEAGEDEMDWKQDVLGEMADGEVNDRFLGYWDYSTRKTVPLILAEIPVKNPWEVFAYLPFGGWNECPDTPELMAAAKHWFEQYGAAAAVMTHDELEFAVPSPVDISRAMELAEEQYAFCPDVVDQGQENATVGTLADSLRQSKMWYFWWD